MADKKHLKISEKDLEQFFINNKQSSFKETDDRYLIIKPWGDNSLIIELSDAEIVHALNNTILPSRFSAIFHIKEQVIEFIWGYISKTDEIIGRSFKLVFNGKEFVCEFDQATSELLTISKFISPTSEYSQTKHRNLLFYKIPAMKGELNQRVPISFFIKGFDNYNEDYILSLARHINFYIEYYDRKSPTIDIHMPLSAQANASQRDKLIDTFPTQINVAEHDVFLLDLMLAAAEANPRLAFLYYYQVLEYAAFYFIDSDIKQRMQRILSTPHIHDEADLCINQLLNLTTEMRQSDESKIDKIVDAYCSPDLIWGEIEPNKEFFQYPQAFDGGFIIDELIGEETTLSSFKSMWHPKTIKIIRKIRNSIVHVREARQDMSLAPTIENTRKLRPWLNIIRRMAEQVVIYS